MGWTSETLPADVARITTLLPPRMSYGDFAGSTASFSTSRATGAPDDEQGVALVDLVPDVDLARDHGAGVGRPDGVVVGLHGGTDVVDGADPVVHAQRQRGDRAYHEQHADEVLQAGEEVHRGPPTRVVDE